MKIKHNFDTTLMYQHIQTVEATYGMRGWMTASGVLDRCVGFSLTYNPNLTHDCDVNYHTLGTPRNTLSEFFIIKPTIT